MVKTRVAIYCRVGRQAQLELTMQEESLRRFVEIQSGCCTPTLNEDDIKARFLAAINSLITNKAPILDACRTMQKALTDCTEINAELDELLREMEVVSELTKRCIEDNSRTAQDQDRYTERYNGLVERFEIAKAKVERLQAKKAPVKMRRIPSVHSCLNWWNMMSQSPNLTSNSGCLPSTS